MRKFLHILILLFLVISSVAAQLTQIPTSFPGLYMGALDWGDYDNDGDLDLVICGRTSTSSFSQYSGVFRNDNGVFTPEGSTIQGLYDGDVKWGDYDNDGDLDFAIMGRYNGSSAGYTRIYRNDNSTFTQLSFISLTNAYYGSLDWGDYDNDGDLDLIILGRTSSSSFSGQTRIFQNNAGVFTSVITLQGASYGDVEWGDYDNDGDLDIAMTGLYGSTYLTRIYQNNNNNFTDIGAPLVGCFQSSLSWGDYDNDGDLDLALIGRLGATNYLKVYNNNNGSFVDIGPIGTQGFFSGNIQWGDYNNDGYLDLLVVGNSTSKIFLYSGGTFIDSGNNFGNFSNGPAVWGDFDNDNDLDIAVLGHASTVSPYYFTRIYENTNVMSNSVPNPPSGLSSSTGLYTDTIRLNWNKATDIQTTQNGLSYNIYIQAASGGNSTVSPMSLTSSGTRKVARIGNRSQNTTVKYSDLATGKYYWGVQSIDASYKASTFTIDSFTITNNFTQLPQYFGNFEYGVSEWGDYDNDGDLDLAVSGQFGGSGTKIFRNDNGNFVDINANITGVKYGDLDWGDYDNDGDLDLIVTGRYTTSSGMTRIYRNDNGVFTYVNYGLYPIFYPSVNFGDADNDGDLDLLIIGAGISRIYVNENGAYSSANYQSLPAGVSNTDAEWGDYDNDGDLDILFTSSSYTRIFNNIGDLNFSTVTLPIPASTNGSVAWGDYDHDGDLDILFTGNNNARIYTNNNGAFTLYSTLTGVSNSEGIWGDYDHDGDLDVFIVGSSNTYLYENQVGTFVAQTYPMANLQVSYISVADYDNDNDLDVFINGENQSFLYRNERLNLNTRPLAPTTISSSTNLYTDTVRLDWSFGTDNETPIFGLSYNIFVGNSISSVEQQVAHSNLSSGDRETAKLGNVSQKRSWKLNQLETGRYYWAVQSIDASYIGSPFSAIDSFDITTRFSEVTTILDQLSYSSLDWGDYDNDGDMDLAICGLASGNNIISKIYRNDAGLFTDIGAGIQGIYYGDLKWGDYDNDGDLDLLLSGRYTTLGSRTARLYRNNSNGTFTQMLAPIQSTDFGSVDWGDADNDGDLDILITGSNYCRIYLNDEGVITTTFIPLAGVSYSHGIFADYDNDADMDVIVTGNTGTRLYRNDGGQLFTSISTTIPTGSYGSIDMGDYDADNDLDLLFTGNNSTRVYRNDGGAFVLAHNLNGISSSNGLWGDIDNDGDLDILTAGSSTIHLYENIGNAFQELELNNVPTVSDPALDFVDFDNDNDLDFSISGGYYTGLFRNQVLQNNSIPSPPSSLQSNAILYSDTATLSWNAGFDTETDSNALCYNLYIGESPNFIDEVSPHSDLANGYRKLTKLGNANLNQSFSIGGLNNGVYYWAVQSIDGTFVGSPFSVVDSFEIINLFDPIGSSAPGIYRGDVEWGDYDNDGDLDFALSGQISGGYFSDIYRNDNGTFTAINAGIMGMFYSTLEWGDIDNDGDLDLAIAGYSSSGRRTEIYQNNNGSFTLIPTPLPNIDRGSLDFGDFDNDGDLDLLITGTGYARIYHNENGSFSSSASTYIYGLSNSDGRFADYDNDGDLDVLITGSGLTRLYQNNGGAFTFVSTPFTGTSYGSIDWGDYDNDGDLDVLITGSNISRLYRNNNGSFSLLQNLDGQSYSTGKFGDFDNDGDLDILTVGSAGTFLYENDNNIFLPFSTNLPSWGNYSDIAWGDYDNDGDLDLLYGGNYNFDVFENYISTSNTIPSSPSGFIMGNKIYSDTATIGWNLGNDFETPQNGLSYNLVLGQQPFEENIDPAMANLQTGYRRIVHLGMANQNTNWEINNLDLGWYYCAVQSVDHSFAGSPFLKDSFKVVGIITGNIANSLCGNDTIFVPYTLNDTLDNPTTFTVQLSDASGNFNSAINIGSIIATSSGIIPAIIPANTAIGSAYRVRVIASNPNMYGRDNGTNITIYPAPTASISANSATSFCQGGSVTLISAWVSGGSYQWYRDGVLITGATSYTYSANQSGDYTVVTSRYGCTNESNTITVTVHPYPSANLIPTGNVNICQGDSIALTTNNYPLGIYTWYHNGFIISNANTNTYYTSIGGDYSVEVSVNGCATTSNTSNVSINPSPIASISTLSGIDTFCQGSSTTLNTQNYFNANYQWFVGGSSIPGANQNTLNISQAGNYSVIVTLNGCQSISPIKSIYMESAPTVSANGGTTFCQGGSVLLSSPTVAGYNYQWKRNGANIPGANSSQYLANTQGNYTLEVSNTYCAFISNSISVNVIALPTALINIPNTTLCQGDTSLITAYYDSDYSYQWKLNGVNIGSATGFQLDATQAGNYSVEVTSNSTGCSATSNTISINTVPTPNAQIQFSGNTSFCQGGNILLSNSSQSTNYSYQWHNNSSLIPGATNNQYVASSTGSYTLNITDNQTGCSNTSNPVNITVFSLPNSTISSSGNSSVCQGDTISLSVPLSNNSQYQWYNNSSLIVGATNNSISVMNAGSYSVEVIDNNGCSSTSTPFNISVIQLPAATINNPSPINLCQGETTTLNANTGTNLLYTWYQDGVSIPNNNSSSISVGAAANYYVEVSNSFGCVSNSNLISVNTFPLPNINFNLANNQYCRNADAISLTASPNGGNFSGNGVVGNIFHPNLVSGTNSTIVYSFTDINNCTDSVGQIISIDEIPTASYNFTHLCQDNLIQFNNTTIDSNQSISNILWNIDNDSFYGDTPLIIFDSSGQYNSTLIIESNAGCIDSISQIVDAVTMPLADYLHADTIPYGIELEITNNSQFSNDYNWLFDNTDSSTLSDPVYFFLDTSYHDIMLIASNSIGCSDTMISTVYVRPVLKRDYELILYPNPTNGQFWINIELNQEANVEVPIFSVLGQVVHEVDYELLPPGFNSLEVILPNDLAKGTYFVGLFVNGKNVNVSQFDNGVFEDKPLKFSKYRKVILTD